MKLKLDYDNLQTQIAQISEIILRRKMRLRNELGPTIESKIEFEKEIKHKLAQMLEVKASFGSKLHSSQDKLRKQA